MIFKLGLLSSSTTPPFAGRLLSAFMDGFLCFVAALLPDNLFSSNIFRMIPISMSNNLVPCYSVNGLVNIKNYRNRVTTFLAVVICMPTSIKNPKVKFHEKCCNEILRFKCSTTFKPLSFQQANITRIVKPRNGSDDLRKDNKNRCMHSKKKKKKERKREYNT